MVTLAWKIKELDELNQQGRTLHSAIGVLPAKLTGECRWIDENISSQLKDIRKQLAVFIKGVTRHQRTPATHVLVFMIRGTRSLMHFPSNAYLTKVCQTRWFGSLQTRSFMK